MVVPKPGEEPRLFAFVRPFQPTVKENNFIQFQYKIDTILMKVWLLLFITMLTMVFSLSLFSKISLISENNNNSEESTLLKLKKKPKHFKKKKSNWITLWLIFDYNLITFYFSNFKLKLSFVFLIWTKTWLVTYKNVQLSFIFIDIFLTLTIRSIHLHNLNIGS